MTKIKYCGIVSTEDVAVINELKIDYVGFVFAKKSRRYVTPEIAKALKEHLSSEIKTVGVFTDEDVYEVANLYKSGVIDVAQLHADENDDYIDKLRKLCDVKIIKAFGITTKEDVVKANNSTADMILLDSKGGGTGKTFNWELLKDVKRNYFLAGGLNAENIKEAIDSLNPYGVDISSGIETDGIKDVKKMKELSCLIREK